MTLTPRARKLALTAHIAASVGWMGADASFLALAVVGLTSRDAQTVRAVYIVMGLLAWYVIVPLSFAALLTGLVQSLGTKWGLLRHYWIVVKFVIVVFAAIILLVHTQPIDLVAAAAAHGPLAAADLTGPRFQLVVAAAAGLVALLAATTLAVYKPRGLTPYGWRRQQAERAARAS